jgi:hypothetical protein
VTTTWLKRENDRILSTIKDAPACSIESALPSTSFSAWLSELAGRDGKVDWDVLPGCMLAPTGKTYAEYPLCVRVFCRNVALEYGGEIVLNVGRVRRDGRSQLAPPSVELVLGVPDDAKGFDDYETGNLSRLAQRAASSRRPPKTQQ